MEAIIRRKLSMAGKALAFERANPATDASHTNVVARLDALVTRTDAVFLQERKGSVGQQAATNRRHELRDQLHIRMRHLVTVAKAASRTEPALAGQFVAASISAPNRIFIGTAKVLLELATQHQDSLVAAGLGTSFVAEATDLIAQFEAVSLDGDNGRRNHVEARADFAGLVAECMEVVGVIDGLNRVRFEKEPELLATWKSVRNVFGPFVKKEEALPSAALPPVGATHASPTI